MNRLENVKQLVDHHFGKFICFGVSDNKFVVHILRDLTENEPVKTDVKILSNSRCICKVGQKLSGSEVLQSAERYVRELGNILKSTISDRIKSVPEIQNTNFFHRHSLTLPLLKCNKKLCKRDFLMLTRLLIAVYTA